MISYKHFFSWVIVACLSLFTLNAAAQLEFPEDKVSWKFTVEQKGDEAFVVGTISMVQHWHVYAAHLPEGTFLIPTSVSLKPSADFKLLGKVIEPKPTYEKDEITGDDLYYHSNTVKLKQKIKVLSEKDFTIKGVFTFQTCDATHCLPPYDAEFTVKVKGLGTSTGTTDNTTEMVDQGDSIKVEVQEPNTDKADSDKTGDKGEALDKKKSKKSNMSMWMIFIISFISGFAALLTPCVFPMIPMTVSFFTKTSKSKSEGIRNAIFYGISIVIIYVLLGTIVTAVFGSDALNALSTNVWFNLSFFVLLVIFAVSFMGAFEIRLPSSWLNKADQASDKGGLIGIFFMALALALVSFSCTGPIVGTLLVESATIGGAGPFVGMLGFSLALALPFSLFAAFPGWMNTLPKSGGWLNTVKVFLGFLELALAFKFLSNADLVVQAHLLERELFLSIWIGIFFAMALYLFGMIRLPHDSPLEKLSVGRTLLGTTTIIFVIYLIPGLWGAPLKLISGFPPPMAYSESPSGVGGGGSIAHSSGPEGTHLGPQGIFTFDDLDKGMAYAKSVNKPVFLDFTGHACVNCRKMEETVWGEPGIKEILQNDVVIISLYVDDKRELPASEQKEVSITEGKTMFLKTIGNKWSYLQMTRYKTNTQPYYIMTDTDGKDLGNASADYENHRDPAKFKAWLNEGLMLFKK